MMLMQLAFLWAAIRGTVEASSLPSVPVDHEPFVQLEHVNLNSGETWSDACEEFWFDVLRCGRDPRAVDVLELTNDARRRLDVSLLGGLTWANVGLQQFHLPWADTLERGEDGKPWQTVRGEIVLSWPEEKIPGLRDRLNRSSTTTLLDNDDDEEVLLFTGSGNNTFRIVKGDRKIGPFLDLHDTHLPGNPSEGLGMKSIRFEVPRRTARGICEFYREIFDAVALLSPDESSCSLLVGFVQSLDFVEKDDVESYDRHHVAVYLNGPAFESSYRKLKQRNLVYFNPRFPQFHYDTYQDALFFNEYRFKDIVGEEGRMLYELEHEIRTLDHQGFRPFRSQHHSTSCTE